MDSKLIQLPTAEEIEAEAASWLAVLGREEVSRDELAQLQIWLKQSNRHRQAFDALSSLWGDLAILKELDDIGQATTDLVAVPTPLWRRRSVLAMAASLFVALIGSGLFYQNHVDGLYQTDQFMTRVGAQRTFELSDGSTVQLNTNSELEVKYSPARRIVRLVRGEVHFDVVSDKERPFTVFAANSTVTAVGTAFTVRLRTDDAVEVMVVEGIVALAAAIVPRAANFPTGDPLDQGPITELFAGQSTIFDRQVDTISQIPQSELSRKLSWRQGLLAYSGESLEEVVADISRYTDVHIEILDPSLRQMPIGGYFRVGEVEALFDSLELTFGLRIERVNEQYVRISAGS